MKKSGVVDVLVSSKEREDIYTTLDFTARMGDDTIFKEDDLKETGDDGDGANKV
jgi:hypothetical protein